jgi:hypothetical protein
MEKLMNTNRTRSINQLRRFALTLLCASMFAACGTDEENVPDEDTGTSDTGGSDGGADGGADTDNDAGGPDSTTTCTDPDPRGCVVLGCGEGEECVESGAEGCSPSACSCDEESGTWQCTADCGPMFACQPIQEELCPDEVPIGGECDPSLDDLECSWGTETCCGQTNPSTVCTCGSGNWACLATDACFIQSCEGRTCEEQSDCQGGGVLTSCIDGVCVQADNCTSITDASACDEAGACQWQEESACPTTEEPSPIVAGCFPLQDCLADSDCPTDHRCLRDIEVLPQCARGEGAVCEACSSLRNLCVPAVE